MTANFNLMSHLCKEHPFSGSLIALASKGFVFYFNGFPYTHNHHVLAITLCTIYAYCEFLCACLTLGRASLSVAVLYRLMHDMIKDGNLLLLISKERRLIIGTY